MAAKPSQIILIVVAVLAMCGSILYTCSQVPNTESMPSMYLVDIRTGEIFEARMPKDRPVMFPAKHPGTQEECLFPAVNKNGKWFVENRYLEYALKPKAGEPKPEYKGLSDVKSGEIKASAESPIKADVFK